jgi:hypothetical protein
MLEIEKTVCELDPIKPSEAAGGRTHHTSTDYKDGYFDPQESAARRGVLNRFGYKNSWPVISIKLY